MSPNDEYFLKALGIKPEEIAPAAPPSRGFIGVGESATYETCPNCSRKRHRNLTTGEIFCLSCKAREQRAAGHQILEAQLAYAQRRAADKFQAESARQVERSAGNLPTYYKRFEVCRIEGIGWAYRLFGDHIYGRWMKAESLQDAMQKIDRLAAPESRERDEVHVENECRGCGGPCGPHRWCKACGRDKLGSHQ